MCGTVIHLSTPAVLQCGRQIPASPFPDSIVYKASALRPLYNIRPPFATFSPIFIQILFTTGKTSRALPSSSAVRRETTHLGIRLRRILRCAAGGASWTRPLGFPSFGGYGGQNCSFCLAGTLFVDDRPPTHFFVKKKFSSIGGAENTTQGVSSGFCYAQTFCGGNAVGRTESPSQGLPPDGGGRVPFVAQNPSPQSL